MQDHGRKTSQELPSTPDPHRAEPGLIEELASLIEPLSGLVAPSGAEDAAIRFVIERLRAADLEPEVDPLGNVIARIPAASSGPLVMLTAHMDEVGFVVRRIEEDGFVRVHGVGGVNDRVLAGQRVVFLGAEGLVEGAMGLKAKHLSTPDELQRSIPVDEAYVDVLARSAQEVREMGLEVGSLGSFAPHFTRRGSLVRGKALDDRLGVAVLLHLAHQLAHEPPACQVVLVASVHEEFSVRGVVTAARGVNPDLAVSVDVAVATDTPDSEGYSAVRLGAGAVITAYARGASSGLIPNPNLRRALLETATALDLPVQHAVLKGGLSEGSFIQYEGRGIPTLDVGFPVRYTHTAVETADLNDVAQAARLVLGFLASSAPQAVVQRGRG